MPREVLLESVEQPGCVPRLYRALQHPFDTGTTLTCPHRVALSLQKPTPSHGPLTPSLQVTSSRTYSAPCCSTISRSNPLRAGTTSCSSWWLAQSSRSRKMDGRELVEGPTFISCSSCSCRRLRSSSSSSSLPLDLRLMSAPNSTAKTTSHVSGTAGASDGTSPPGLHWPGCQGRQWS